MRAGPAEPGPVLSWASQYLQQPHQKLVLWAPLYGTGIEGISSALPPGRPPGVSSWKEPGRVSVSAGELLGTWFLFGPYAKLSNHSAERS